MIHIPEICRAALVELLDHAGTDEQRDAYATLLGFESDARQGETAIPSASSEGPVAADFEEQPQIVVQRATQERQPLKLWRLAASTTTPRNSSRETPDWYVNAAIIRKDELLRRWQTPVPLAHSHLMPWARLWPFLRKQVSSPNAAGPIDIKRCVERIARQKPLLKLPRRRVMKWPPAIHCLVDHSTEMRSFYPDMRQVVTKITEMCGRHRVKRMLLPNGITHQGFFDSDEFLTVYRQPTRAVALLALSDLGFYRGDASVITAWHELGRAARLRNCRTIALIPCHPATWDCQTLTTWRGMHWDLGQRAIVACTPLDSEVLTGVRDDASHDARPAVREQSRAMFFRLLAPLIRDEPELVRRIRCLLPSEATDASMETDVLFLPREQELSRRSFAQLPLKIRISIAEFIGHYHGHMPEILAMEYAILQAIDPELVARMASAEFCAFLGDLAKTLNSQNWQRGGFSANEMRGWFARMERLLPDEAYRNRQLAAAWVMAHKTPENELDTKIVPAHLPLKDVSWALASQESREYYLIRSGDDLAAQPVEAGHAVGLSLGDVSIHTSQRTLFVTTRDVSGKQEQITWRPEEPLREFFSREALLERVVIESPDESLTLILDVKPPWAAGIGRDKTGLFVDLRDKRRLYWFNPGRYEVKLKERSATLDSNKGFWWDKDGFLDWRANTFGNLDWAEECGQDEFGVYADFSIGAVRRRMRWIWPDTFLMGSPQGEPERLDDEQQHEVILSKGYWLDETACTQELWREVMGKNPSNFKGENLPVETVSWDDCQQFIRALNDQKPGLDLRLPTEAEWEFACRAGSTTPFSLGENITPEQVNYNGKYPYDNAEKGENRGTTVAVKTFLCNTWGLYEMHGNVWEWCGDWFGDYPVDTAVDPTGPDGGSNRVLRGGGWISFARYCRSAYRYCSSPGDRLDFNGFRLARGQNSQVTGSGPGEGRTAEERSDRRSVPNKERGGDNDSVWSSIKKRIFK